MSAKRQVHELRPFLFDGAEVLILGTFPSPKSRETGFYYGHPQNRFWKVMAEVFACGPLDSIDKKQAFLYEHKIALWDVLASCEIEGASDASIRSAVANDIPAALARLGLGEERVFATGKTAHAYLLKLCGINARLLPSPSPANCAVKFSELVLAYSAVKTTLESALHHA